MYVTPVKLISKSNDSSKIQITDAINSDVLKIVGSEALSRQVSLMEFFNVAQLPSTIIEELKILPVFDKYHITIKDQYGDSILSEEDDCEEDEDEVDYVTKSTNDIERWGIYNRHYDYLSDIRSDIDYKKLRSMIYHIEW
jgi:hypothetical protein